MKKVFLLSLAAGILCGCAMGINHNIATINGTPYLIETKNYGFLVTQWSKESKLLPLEDPDLNNKSNTSSQARAELIKIAEQCNVKSVNINTRINYKRLYKCVIDKLSELEQNAN